MDQKKLAYFRTLPLYLRQLHDGALINKSYQIAAGSEYCCSLVIINIT